MIRPEIGPGGNTYRAKTIDFTAFFKEMEK